MNIGASHTSLALQAATAQIELFPRVKGAGTNRQSLLGGSRGFTLLEVVFAMALLSVAVLGLALSIPAAAQSNARNRIDAEGALLVQQELEQMVAQPVSASSFIDSGGRTISIAPGGAPLANGAIDYSEAAVTGYSATVTGSSGAQYVLRWNVQLLADGSKHFTIAAKRNGSLPFLLPPVNVAARRSR